MARKSSFADKAKNKVKLFTAWSLSRYLDYGGPDGCPRKAMRKYIDKADTGPKNAAMQRGSDIHTDGARWLAKKIRSLPETYRAFATEMKWLRTHLVCFEQQWAFTEDWEECDWFASDAWSRIVLDALGKVKKGVYRVVDYKTGKYRDYKIEEYRLQLELYALAVFLRFPDCNEVHCELWYLDEGIIYGGEEDGFVFTRDQLDELRDAWNARVRNMMIDRKFKATPGNACTFCFDSVAKGGKCRY